VPQAILPESAAVRWTRLRASTSGEGGALPHLNSASPLHGDPRYQLAAASTAICFFTELRGQVRQEINKEKHYAAEGAGVIDMEKMYDRQRELRYIDEAIAMIRSELAEKHATPLGCSDPLVEKTALCVGWHVMNTFPRGSASDAVERFCSSGEMRAAVGLVNLGEKAPYWDGADQAIINVSFELDRAHLVARSAEVCIGATYAPMIEAKLESAKPADRKVAQRFQRTLKDSRRELEQAGLNPMPCDDALVRQLIKCVKEKGDDVGVKPGCRSPELKEAMSRLSRE
jgi:hypothetical protein